MSGCGCLDSDKNQLTFTVFPGTTNMKIDLISLKPVIKIIWFLFRYRALSVPQYCGTKPDFIDIVSTILSFTSLDTLIVVFSIHSSLRIGNVDSNVKTLKSNLELRFLFLFCLCDGPNSSLFLCLYCTRQNQKNYFEYWFTYLCLCIFTQSIRISALFPFNFPFCTLNYFFNITSQHNDQLIKTKTAKYFSLPSCFDWNLRLSLF